jgi:ADP-ribose pyrophosphatase
LFESQVPVACQSDVQIIGKNSIKDATVLKDLLSGMAIESLNPPQPKKSRAQIAKGYPPRQLVDETDSPWTRPLANYFPPEYTSGVVFQNDGKWADPRDVREVKRRFLTLSHGEEAPVRLDALGRPLNPLGRTGLQGRGLLGRWGRNLAGDPLVTRVSPENARLQLLVIERKDSGLKALPGGMVDEGEDINATVARELLEETSAELDFKNAKTLFAGVVDDPRNTDNAWMETTVLHKHLTATEHNDLTLQAGDDASAVHWVDVNEELLASMYASHADYVRLALRELRSDPTIAEQVNTLLAH